MGVHEDVGRDGAAIIGAREAEPAAGASARAPRRLTGAQRKRAVGSVLGAAVGDALGAPYEFLGPMPSDEAIDMVGGGVLGWETGEWTDDTDLAATILMAVADAESEEAPGIEVGSDAVASAARRCVLCDERVLDRIAGDWYAWALATGDIGALTSRVISDAGDVAHGRGDEVPSAEDFRLAASTVAEETSMNAGNGSLMRTHAVAIATLLADDDCARRSALEVSRLTHVNDETDDACVLWTFAVRHAILTGELDIRAGLPHVPRDRRRQWEERIVEAEESEPAAFPRNGWVVHAFQAAWSAVSLARRIPAGKFEQREAAVAVLEAAVRAGYDTDTVGCIAGGLVGAALGPKATPPEWRRVLHGWPGLDAESLADLVRRAIGQGRPAAEADGAPVADARLAASA